MSKCLVIMVDTENVSPKCIESLKSMTDYIYPTFQNVGIFCFGMEDGKSGTSEGWKRLVKERCDKALHWQPVVGPRVKNKVDRAICDKIAEFMDNPKFSRIDVWVIATSDGDFKSAIKCIKNHGHRAVIASDTPASNKLIELCDVFYRLWTN